MSKRDEVRDAIVAVLGRHGYDIPGVADLCAGAAIKTMREPSLEMTEAMASVISPRLSVFGNVSGRDIYHAAIEAAQ